MTSWYFLALHYYIKIQKDMVRAELEMELYHVPTLYKCTLYVPSSQSFVRKRKNKWGEILHNKQKSQELVQKISWNPVHISLS